MEKFEDHGIDVKGRTSGQIKVVCPKCSHTRKKKKEPCLSVNITDGSWTCHNPGCDFQGRLKQFERIDIKKKDYKLPELNNTELSDKTLAYFQGRGISTATINRNRITESMSWMPQVEKEVKCINFNYFRDGHLVNIKFRDAKKNFKLNSGSELIFYGLDDIKDTDSVVIVEGEVDRLSFEEAGVLNCISVPNGASASGNLRLEYLDNCWEYFTDKQKIYLATDNDGPGIALREELARRLGRERCFKVLFPEGCKDANDVLVKHGPEKLKECLGEAEEYPIEGVLEWGEYKDEINDLYENGLESAYDLGLDDLDKHFKIYRQIFTIINGIPGHGKTSVALEICVRLAIRHGWVFAVFCPENMPVRFLFKKLSEYIIGKPFLKGRSERMELGDLDDAMAFLEKHFILINFEDYNTGLDDILRITKALVFKRGINGLLIDPWNTLNHVIPAGKNETTYVDDSLKKINIAKKLYSLHIFLGVHPTKMQKGRTKKQDEVAKHEVPSLYDISGSASFYNKCDIGITVYTHFDIETTDLHIQKMKFEWMGKKGMVSLKYNHKNNRHFPENTIADDRNWLISPDCNQVSSGSSNYLKSLGVTPEYIAGPLPSNYNEDDEDDVVPF